MVDWNDPKQACAEYKRLDAKFDTHWLSPLHHDQRCDYCRNAFIAEHFVVVTVP